MDINELQIIPVEVSGKLLDDLLQSGSIWISGTRPESIMAQVMHYNKDKKLVFCIQKVNYGYKDIAPDTYDLDEFLENFAYMGVKK